MGCDIHMYVEYKRTINGNEQWVCGDYFKHNPYYTTEDKSEQRYSKLELHGNRNYQLFTTLAGVRDYSESVVPVSDPRGLPEDCCEFVTQENEKWDGDGHTHSWLSLKDLREYQNADPVMHYSGLISRKQQYALDSLGETPNEWCQGTNQEGYERRKWSEPNKSLIPLIEKLQRRALELLQYEWQEYNIENDTKIRIVFWFDN